jgi:hypothetical protein
VLVDHERVIQRLKEEMADKQGIGRDGLFALIARLEVECRLEEGAAERALRVFGNDLSDDLIKRGVQPAPSVTQASPADGDGPAPPEEELHDGRRNRREDRADRRVAVA